MKQKLNGIKMLSLLVFTFVLLFLFLLQPLNAQTITTNQPTVQTVNSNKRQPFQLKLLIDDSKSFSLPVNETDYVINDTILYIFAGEKLFVESTLTNNRVTKLRVVNEIKDPSKTFVIDFQQKTTGKVHQMMSLTISNPYNKQLRYKAMMNLLQNNKWVNTSVYPVLPNIKAIEMWQAPITMLALGSFELKD